MHYYQQIFANLQQTDPAQAEALEEEVNIMIHKLKFLPSENFPHIMLLRQSEGLDIEANESLIDKVRIAGGHYSTDKANAQVLVILKEDESLYSVLPAILDSDSIQNTPAYRDNKVFIIETSDFGDDQHFLRDIEILAEIMQPKYFYFGHEGEAWTKFDLVHS